MCIYMLGMVVHAYNPRHSQAKIKRLQVLDIPGLHCKTLFKETILYFLIIVPLQTNIQFCYIFKILYEKVLCQKSVPYIFFYSTDFIFILKFTLF